MGAPQQAMSKGGDRDGHEEGRQGRPEGLTPAGGPELQLASDGTARIHFQASPNLHRVPDKGATASVAAQLNPHLGPECVACLIQREGQGVIRGSGPGMIPDKKLQATLAGVAMALNKHEARDGHWVVALGLREHTVCGMWRDADGDCHALVEFGEPAEIADWTDVDFGAQACAALDATFEQQRRVDVQPSQQIRLALGQKPTRH